MRNAPPRPAAVALLCLALSMLWVSGAHLHLCTDGLEPPTSVHSLIDGSDHVEKHGAEGEHVDSDVGFEASLARVSKHGDAPAISISAAHVSTRVRSTVLLYAGFEHSSVRPSARYLRPPLRAPPA